MEEEKATVPENEKSQLSFPLDLNSSRIIERLIQALKWPRSLWKNRGFITLIPVTDKDTAITVGDGKQIWTVPEELDGTLIQSVAGYVTTVSASGGPILVQLRNITDSVDILSTRINIDDSEFNSYDAATQPVINFTNAQLTKGDRIAVDVDDAGDGAAKGLTIKVSAQ